MKSLHMVYGYLLLFYLPTAFASVFRQVVLSKLLTSANPAWRSQTPTMITPNIALPPFTSDKDHRKGTDEVIISDVIGKERTINVFAGFTRDIESISKRLEDSEQNTTVLAPLNSKIQQLPRKPWEDPKDYEVLGEEAYEGEHGEDRAQMNIRRFVEAHIVPTSPWCEGEKLETLGGTKVWWQTKDDKKLIQPGDIEVSSIADKVANGEIWILKGVLNYER